MNKLFPTLLAPLMLLAACNTATSTEPPLRGATIGGPFRLIDQNGTARTDRDFAGKWRIVYFGYTFCPDVCPTDVQAIGAAVKQVEARDATKGRSIVPIFVTVDPARDTPAVLKQYVVAFHPRMVGLTGSADAIAAAEKGYAIYARRGATSPGGGYLMDHSRQAYLMDPAGLPIALLPAEQGADAVARELERWVK